ncbi:MAG: glycosyltransferase family 2 protein [Nanoarchaeota archaeon]|nr:glycosyltransferase family 2 protein [Nanoarchaeota archaeon]MBU1051275.1 glycosyltransferase family 2 protein [Nanoarchaeota archaeon]
MINSLDTSSKKQKVIVMIPAYNEEATIGKVIRDVPRKVNGIAEVEVMVMDDYSGDKTAEVAKRAGADYIFKQKQNVGLGVNFKKGIDMALKLGADIIVNIDGDGQFDSKDIENLVRPILRHEADMVTCSRFLNPNMTKNMPWLKKWGNRRFTNLISRITKEKFTDTQCGFRAYGREAALRLTLKGKFTYTQEVFIDLIEKGMRIKEIPLKVVYHKKRDSKISGNLRKYGFKSLGIIAKATRDTKPLDFFGMPALVILFLGMIGGGVSFVYWLIYHATTPVRTLFNVSVFFMIFGLALGILALIADMMKTIKTTQDEILYRLKRQDVENSEILNKLNGGIERVDNHIRKTNGGKLGEDVRVRRSVR